VGKKRKASGVQERRKTNDLLLVERKKNNTRKIPRIAQAPDGDDGKVAGAGGRKGILERRKGNRPLFLPRKGERKRKIACNVAFSFAPFGRRKESRLTVGKEKHFLIGAWGGSKRNVTNLPAAPTKGENRRRQGKLILSYDKEPVRSGEAKSTHSL